MHLKDYYKTLELEPSATLDEIKQSFRRLALLHHPDKNNNSPQSIVLFSEIKEAYEVLTNPSRKELYLQQRWYNQSLGKKKTQSLITPAAVLKEALELERYVSRLDAYRMDKQGLCDYILAQFENTTIEKLNSFGEQDVNDQIIEIMLRTIRPLKAAQADQVARQLFLLASDNTKPAIEKAIATIRTKQYWDEKEWLIVLLVTVMICFLIWFIAR